MEVSYAHSETTAAYDQTEQAVHPVPQMLLRSKKEASGAELLRTEAFLRLAAMEGPQPLAMSLQHPG